MEVRKSSATSDAYKDLITTMIFPAQNNNEPTTPLLARRYGEPALQNTDQKLVPSAQSLPPDVQTKNCKISASLVSVSGNPKIVQHPTPGPPHCGAGKSSHQSEERSRPKTVSQIAGSVGFTGNARKISISGSSIGRTTTVKTTTAEAYTDFVVDVQYSLSEEILDPGLRKRADQHVHKLFNGRHVYAPYLTVLVVPHVADTAEYRHKLIAASSIYLYQTHCLFEAVKNIPLEELKRLLSRITLKNPRKLLPSVSRVKKNTNGEVSPTLEF